MLVKQPVASSKNAVVYDSITVQYTREIHEPHVIVDRYCVEVSD